jgi:hypothetical protein
MIARAERAAFAAVLLLLGAASLALALHGNVEHQSFKAFYCAGVAVRGGHDPYLVEPLRACERRYEATQLPAGYVEPAPLPGYALAPFVVLSLLPMRAAAILFALLLVLAAGAGAKCLSASIRAPSAAILLALTPLTLLNVAFGEIAPLAMLALCCAAYYLRNGRSRAAGVAVSFALLQPNVGFAAVLAMLLLVPRARAAIASTTGAFAIVSLAMLGVAGNAEYFFDVLPLMARAELPAADQFSSSRLFYLAGASPGLAILMAQLWFVISLSAGIILARAFARAGQPDMVALLPPAAVLLLGLYLHDVQILIAVPAALVVTARAPSPVFRALGAAGVALLVAVWTQRADRAVIALDFAGVAGGLYAVLRGTLHRRLLLAAAGAAIATLCFVLVNTVAPSTTAADLHTHPFDAAPSAFAAAAWAKYLLATPALRNMEFAPQIAAWSGLLILLACALGSRLGQTDANRRDGDLRAPLAVKL